MKKLRMKLTLLMVGLCSWQSAWAQGVEVTVESIAEAGELGIEILKKHDPINEVTSLTVQSGTLNDADWATIRSIPALTTLDLRGVSNESMPNHQFNKNNSGCDADNLVTVWLPSNLKTIGEYAFSRQSSLVNVYIPSTLESLGQYAFNNCSALTSIGLDALPSAITVIPRNCFDNCQALGSFTIPEGVTSIEQSAFQDCKQFSSTIPSTVISFGQAAFRNAAMNNIDVIINEGATISSNYSNGTFSGTGIRSISLPSTFYNNPGGVISSCKNLTDIYLKSPTVLSNPGTGSSWGDFLADVNLTNLTIHVPTHLLEAYKLDSYFKDYSNLIVGGATVGVGEAWTINAPLTLSYSRMPASSNIILNQNNSLQVKGSEAQVFDNVTTYGHTSYSQSWDKYSKKDWSMIINTCDNVSITGTYKHKIETYGGKWYFFSLPFDFRVGDIVTDNNVKYAIRYYDGAARAASGTGSSWKDYGENDVVTAGTGFIIQTSSTTWVTFTAQANDSRNNVVSNSAFVKALADNDAATAADKGWNLVGNPWQSYYNIHKVNYSAPISVWTGSTYEAYSIADDDYAIRPNEAFFVQSPGSSTSITFPIDGRQLTDEIQSQIGARAYTNSRKIFDLQIAYGELTDKTRLVVNPEASMDYEISCDASKMMSMDAKVPQIYSFGPDKTQYAINERPEDNCELHLGINIKQDGEYTLKAIRNSFGQVFLKDNETGITTDLEQNDYVFSAKTGTLESRFVVYFGSIGGNDDATGINTINSNDDAIEEIFTLDGVRVGNSRENLKKGVYIVRKGQKTQKIIIK